MMFQSYALFPHMTVEQNIAFGLKQDKLPANEIKSRVAEMLTLVHMQEFADVSHISCPAANANGRFGSQLGQTAKTAIAG